VYVLRIYRHGWRTHDQIAAETRCLTWLKTHGLPVSVPIRTSENDNITCFNAPEGIRYAVLFSYAKGSSLYRSDLCRSRCSYRYGQIIGELHKALKNYPARDTRRPILDLDFIFRKPFQHLKPFAQKYQKLYRVLDCCQELLHEVVKHEQSVQLIHGDVDPGNIHFTGKYEATLFDFDFLGYGWRAYDLAVAMWEFQFAGWEKAVGREFLRGYEETYGLDQKTEALMNLLMPFRGPWFLGLVAQNVQEWDAHLLINPAIIDKHVDFFFHLYRALSTRLVG
jgi:Ser/Thr protein kinase RdoA (MazF antagonist)